MVLEGDRVMRHREVYRVLLMEQMTGRGFVRTWVNWQLIQPKCLGWSGKDFNWLGAWDRLPVRERLFQHRVSRTPLCPRGCGEEESVGHAFWGCAFAKSFWSMVEEWWKGWGGPVLTRDLVVWGVGLRRIRGERRGVVWRIVTEGNLVLWGGRGRALRGGEADKSPGGGGLSAEFYKSFWVFWGD